MHAHDSALAVCIWYTDMLSGRRDRAYCDDDAVLLFVTQHQNCQAACSVPAPPAKECQRLPETPRGIQPQAVKSWKRTCSAWAATSSENVA
jgi:hypothetical protein